MQSAICNNEGTSISSENFNETLDISTPVVLQQLPVVDVVLVDVIGLTGLDRSLLL